MKMKLQFSVLATSVLAVTAAHAVTKTYGVSAGVAHSDNITRVPTNEQSDTLLLGGLDFSFAEETARLRAIAVADLAYVDYQDETYDSELIGDFNGQATFGIIPGRIDWFAQDNFGQVRSDPFQPVTPDNRENINYFTTGPDLTARFGSVTRGRLSGRYSKVTYETSPFDNDRFGAMTSLLRNLSPVTVLSLNLRTEKTEYDDPAAVPSGDRKRHDAFLAYEANLSRTIAEVELGYSILEQSNIADDSKGVLARLSLQRKLSQHSTLYVRLGHEFSDAGSSFRLQQDFGIADLDTESVLQTADPFTSDYAALAWGFTGRRTGFSLGIEGIEESYEQQTALDRRILLGNAQAYRDLTPALRVQIGGYFSKEEFDNIANGDFRETVGSAVLAWRVGRQVSLSVEYERFDRSGDNPLTDYQENRGWLRIRYGVGMPGEVALSPLRSVPIRTPIDADG